jgi:FtsH-binding integral membrane protein
MPEIDPSIIPSSIGITMGIFGGASLMAYNMPKDKMLGYGRIYMGSLLGLIGMQLIGLGSAIFLGPNPLSTLLFQIDNYVGIVLFAGLIGYDTHLAIKQYETGNADHLGMSIQMLLDFWNLLIRIMEIMAKSKRK